MGLLDYDLGFDWDSADDDTSSAFDIENVIDDSDSSALTVDYDDLFSTTSTSFLDDEVWDWIEDADKEDYTYEDIVKLTSDDIEVTEEEAEEEDKPPEESSEIMALLKKVPSSWWDKLLDLGVGGLKSWLKSKEKATAKKSSGGGGGGGKAGPATVLKAPTAIGTRVKG